MIDFENQFPPLKEFTYLNTASSGLIPMRVIEWRSQHDQDFLSQGSIFRDDHKILIEDIRGKVSSYFGASMDDIALIPNFTFGFNTLLDGFDPKMRFFNASWGLSFFELARRTPRISTPLCCY
ncbi:hypothetical protein [Gilvibacter sp.]|uniref:hypothetical protein n=1 Tax=Gilvibacter sp. TaxID=2729997 RepID=UPI003F4A75F2